MVRYLNQERPVIFTNTFFALLNNGKPFFIPDHPYRTGSPAGQALGYQQGEESTAMEEIFRTKPFWPAICRLTT